MTYAPKSGAPPCERVFVKNLPGDSTEASVRAIFEKYATVVGVKVLPPSMGRTTLAGYVSFASVDEATWIVENVSDNQIEGLPEPLTVTFAYEPNKSKGGKDGKGYMMGKGGMGYGGYGMMGGKGMKGSPYDPSSGMKYSSGPFKFYQEQGWESEDSWGYGKGDWDGGKGGMKGGMGMKGGGKSSGYGSYGSYGGYGEYDEYGGYGGGMKGKGPMGMKGMSGGMGKGGYGSSPKGGMGWGGPSMDKGMGSKGKW
mmetsp:Transcript_16611/g.31404  ORF Transcript_16611/g.31404 Transcript_16611/m.31404 type:complete len:254 (+) Transcript_16611:56-817(+)